MWKQAEKLTEEYLALNFNEVQDYEKYKIYSIVTNSTALEGSTLTELDTQLLLDDGIVAGGKPFEHHLMVKDNYEAMQKSLEYASQKKLITPEMLREFNSLNMKSTGGPVVGSWGEYDKSRGDFRKNAAFSEALGYYTNPQKIEERVNEYCEEVNNQLLHSQTFQEKMLSSFNANLNLVLIHPWGDGNKRTSRLIMNYIERYFELPLTKINAKEGKEYLLCLKEAKDNQNNILFQEFVLHQHIVTLQGEISKYKEMEMKNDKLDYQVLMF